MSKQQNNGPIEVEGVRLTHPDRVLYPDQGATKRDLAAYYEEFAGLILPYVAGRPLALVRCPEGRGKDCFFQKHATASMPEDITTVDVAEEDKDEAPHVQIKDEAGLVSLAQIGVLEIHTWGCRSDKVERPDRMIFDLDPDEALDYTHVVEAARDIKQVLDTLELESFPMLTGGKGIHVVVPLERRNTWDQVKPFAQSIARFMQKRDPKRYISVMTKSKRRGKIFVDYLRNGRGATAVAPYSTRARAGAPIAVPQRWEQLTPDTKPNHYTLSNIRRHLSQRRADPWADYAKVRQWITEARREALDEISGD